MTNGRLVLFLVAILGGSISNAADIDWAKKLAGSYTGTAGENERTVLGIEIVNNALKLETDDAIEYVQIEATREFFLGQSAGDEGFRAEVGFKILKGKYYPIDQDLEAEGSNEKALQFVFEDNQLCKIRYQKISGLTGKRSSWKIVNLQKVKSKAKIVKSFDF